MIFTRRMFICLAADIGLASLANMFRIHTTTLAMPARDVPQQNEGGMRVPMGVPPTPEEIAAMQSRTHQTYLPMVEK